MIALIVSAGLACGGAIPAQAAAKRTTTVRLSAIAHVATAEHVGATIISGDEVVLKGTTSANLVGKKLAVQIKQGKSWVAFPGSAKVSRTKTFAITTRATGVGAQVYRVQFAGTKTLKPAKADRSATVWQWFPLVEQRAVDRKESFGGNAPHAVSQVSVAGKPYARLLAGSVYGQATAWSEYNLGYHCRRFTSTVGLGDTSPTGATGTFTVSFDANRAAQHALGLGTTARFDLDASGFFRVRLEASNTRVGSSGSVVTAWPEAAVLCDAPI